MNLLKEMFILRSIEEINLLADFSAKPGRGSKLFVVSLKISSLSFKRPFTMNNSIFFVPRPSILKAAFETK